MPQVPLARAEEAIRALPAGRKLDTLVARQLFQWKAVMVNTHGGRRRLIPPPYSTEMAAAWEVVVQVRRAGNRARGLLDPCIKLTTSDDGSWCEVFDVSTLGYDGTPLWMLVDVEASTIPLAICRAALLVMLAS